MQLDHQSKQSTNAGTTTDQRHQKLATQGRVPRGASNRHLRTGGWGEAIAGATECTQRWHHPAGLRHQRGHMPGALARRLPAPRDLAPATGCHGLGLTAWLSDGARAMAGPAAVPAPDGPYWLQRLLWLGPLLQRRGMEGWGGASEGLALRGCLAQLGEGLPF